MRRSAMPARKTPLKARPAPAPDRERPVSAPMNLDAAKTALRLQAQSAALPRRTHQPTPPVSKPQPKPKSTGFPADVRQLILDRDGHRCQGCRAPIDGPRGYSIQHRDNRGMGGTRDPRINLPSNGLTLCGSATTPGGCHEWAENNETAAAKVGHVVLSYADPSRVPVLTADGWKILDNTGGAWMCPPPPNVDAHILVGIRKEPIK